MDELIMNIIMNIISERIEGQKQGFFLQLYVDLTLPV